MTRRSEAFGRLLAGIGIAALGCLLGTLALLLDETVLVWLALGTFAVGTVIAAPSAVRLGYLIGRRR